MRNFLLPYLILLVFFIPSCQSSARPTPDKGGSLDNNENAVLTLAIPSATPSQLPTQSSPTQTPEEFSQSMFIENEAKDFEMEEFGEPSGDLINSVTNSTGEYHAYDVCNPQCFIYIEVLNTGKVYKLTSPHLQGNRWFSDITWSDETILEFTLVTQPNHGVRFIVDVETQELIDLNPIQLND